MSFERKYEVPNLDISPSLRPLTCGLYCCVSSIVFRCAVLMVDESTAIFRTSIVNEVSTFALFYSVTESKDQDFSTIFGGICDSYLGP